MVFRVRHLDHVVLYAADLDRAIRFYGDVLGCTVERRVEAIGLVQLRASSSLVGTGRRLVSRSSRRTHLRSVTPSGAGGATGRCAERRSPSCSLGAVRPVPR